MQFLGKLAKLWLLLMLFGSAGYFGYFNRERIPVAAPPWIDGITIPAYSAYTAFFLMGAFVTSLYLGMETLRKSVEIRRLTRRLRELDPGAATTASTAPATWRAPAVEGPRRDDVATGTPPGVP